MSSKFNKSINKYGAIVEANNIKILYLCLIIIESNRVNGL